jgi:hypothetical protein
MTLAFFSDFSGIFTNLYELFLQEEGAQTRRDSEEPEDLPEHSGTFYEETTTSP